MQAAGASPYLLTEDSAPEGEDEARSMGWEVEVYPRPFPTPRLRARQHLRRYVVPHNPGLWRRAAELASGSAFAQLEEIGAAQYVRAVAGRTPLAVSLHNVDSEVMAADVEHLGHRDRIRHRYYLSRMVATEKRAVRAADLVLCVSDHDQSHFQAIGGHNCVVAANGVDDALFDVPLPLPNAKVAFFFGQFGWRPNADGALRFIREVWPIVAAAEPEARLRISGPGSAEALASVAASHPRVEVLGFVPKLTDQLAACRLVVAPLWAGGGTRIKVLEALAAGRPVVGTPLGVERLGFISGLHGLSAESSHELAAATVRVLREDEFANRCGLAARGLARGFRWSFTTRPARTAYQDWINVANAHHVRRGDRRLRGARSSSW